MSHVQFYHLVTPFLINIIAIENNLKKNALCQFGEKYLGFVLSISQKNKLLPGSLCIVLLFSSKTTLHILCHENTGETYEEE